MAENETNETPEGRDQTQSWETWLEAQGPEMVALYEEHVGGLRSALQSERQQRREFERQLREAAGQLEQGSQARARLEEMAGGLEQQERRAEFYELAHAAGVTNLRLAWLAVQQDESLTDRRGMVNMTRLQESYPELFGVARRGPGNAGAGTGSQTPKGGGMNEFIRRAAGFES
jgi:hypothetical protein